MTEQRADGLYPYRPSNGTEGEMFMERFCYRCKREQPYLKSDQIGCGILTQTMIHYTTDPEYPTEWVSDDDCGLVNPRCTAFEEVTDG